MDVQNKPPPSTAELAAVVVLLKSTTAARLTAWEEELAPIKDMPGWAARVARMQGVISTFRQRLAILEELERRAGLVGEAVDAECAVRQAKVPWVEGEG